MASIVPQRYTLRNAPDNKAVITDKKTIEIHWIEETKIPEFVRTYLTQHADLSLDDARSLIAVTDFKILFPAHSPKFKRVFSSMNLDKKMQFLHLAAGLQSRKNQPELAYFEEIAQKISTNQELCIPKKAKTVHWDRDVCDAFQQLSLASNPVSRLQTLFSRSIGLKYKLPVKLLLKKAFEITIDQFTDSIKNGYLGTDDVMEEIANTLLFNARISNTNITNTIKRTMTSMFKELNDYFTSIANTADI